MDMLSSFVSNRYNSTDRASASQSWLSKTIAAWPGLNWTLVWVVSGACTLMLIGLLFAFGAIRWGWFATPPLAWSVSASFKNGQIIVIEAATGGFVQVRSTGAEILNTVTQLSDAASDASHQFRVADLYVGPPKANHISGITTIVVATMTLESIAYPGRFLSLDHTPMNTASTQTTMMFRNIPRVTDVYPITPVVPPATYSTVPTATVPTPSVIAEKPAWVWSGVTSPMWFDSTQHSTQWGPDQYVGVICQAGDGTLNISGASQFTWPVLDPSLAFRVYAK